jgi:actin-related protein
METTTVIIDVGSDLTKAGLAGESKPKIVVPTVIGTIKRPNAVRGPMWIGKKYAGDEAIEKKLLCDMSSPVQRGVITNFDNLEVFMRYIHYDAKFALPAADHPLLFSEPPNNSAANREKILKLAFEEISVTVMRIHRLN